jgi:hypothetical protein
MNNVTVTVRICPTSAVWNVDTIVDVGQVFRDSYVNSDNTLPVKYVVGKALEKMGKYIQRCVPPRCPECKQPLPPGEL